MGLISSLYTGPIASMLPGAPSYRCKSPETFHGITVNLTRLNLGSTPGEHATDGRQLGSGTNRRELQALLAFSLPCWNSRVLTHHPPALNPPAPRQNYRDRLAIDTMLLGKNSGR